MIERERIANIKMRHLKILMGKKPKKPSMTPKPRKKYEPKNKEEYRKYRTSVEKEYRNRNLQKGLCRSCSRQAIIVKYLYENKLIFEKKTRFCPFHWENKNFREKLKKGVELANSNNGVTIQSGLHPVPPSTIVLSVKAYPAKTNSETP